MSATNLTVAELKKKLAECGLSRGGRKSDMVARLQQAGVLGGKDKSVPENSDDAGEVGSSGEPVKKKLKAAAKMDGAAATTVKIQWKQDDVTQCDLDKIRENVESWDNILKELQGLKGTEPFCHWQSLLEHTSSTPVFRQSFSWGTPGRKSLQHLWKAKAGVTPACVQIISLIENDIVKRLLQYNQCLACDKGFYDSLILCEHIKGVHIHNIQRSNGRKYSDREKELDGCHQMRILRDLVHSGQLERNRLPLWIGTKDKETKVAVNASKVNITLDVTRQGDIRHGQPMASSHHRTEQRPVNTMIALARTIKALKPGQAVATGEPGQLIYKMTNGQCHVVESVTANETGQSTSDDPVPMISPSTYSTSASITTSTTSFRSASMIRSSSSSNSASLNHSNTSCSAPMVLASTLYQSSSLICTSTSGHSAPTITMSTSSHSAPTITTSTSSHSAPMITTSTSSHSAPMITKSTSSHSAPTITTRTTSHSAPTITTSTSSHSAPTITTRTSSHSAPTINTRTSSHSAPTITTRTSSHSAPMIALSTSSHSAPTIITSMSSRKINLEHIKNNSNLDPQTGILTCNVADVKPKNIRRELNVFGEKNKVENVLAKWNDLKSELAKKKNKHVSVVDVLDHLLTNEVKKENPKDSPLWNPLDEVEKPLPFNHEDPEHYKHILTNWSCINEAVRISNEHGHFCRGDLEPTIGASQSIGFTNKECKYICKKCNFVYEFRPSPVLKGRGVSDYLSTFAASTCGGMKSHLIRHYKTLGMSLPQSTAFLNGDFNMEMLRKVTKKQADSVKNNAIERSLLKNDGFLRLKVDMAHENRRNSASSTLTAMDTSTNDIVFVNSVHRRDEKISQLHERVAAENMCRDIKKLKEVKGVIEVVADEGSKAKAEFKKNFSSILSDDHWHGLNSVERSGNKEFGNEYALAEKIKPIRNYIYLFLKEYKISVEDYQDEAKRSAAVKKIQDSILQLPRHYQGALATSKDKNGVEYHADCFPKARCRTDPNYVNSRLVLTDGEAQRLRNFLEKSKMVVRTEYYILGSNTSNVESFHRIQNVYRDKHNHLSEDMYEFAIDLNTLHAQEMIEGKYEDGVKKELPPMSNGPLGLPKRERPNRDFLIDIRNSFFAALSKNTGENFGDNDHGGEETDDEETEDEESSDEESDDSEVDESDFENGEK